MRDQLKKLEELQKFDAQIQELTGALQAIPAKLDATKNDLARVEGLLNNERAQLAETQRYQSEQKDLVQTDEEHLNSAKSKQSAAKNTKEYAAAQRELDITRESLANRQGEIGKLVEAIQAKEKLLAERESDVKTLRASVEKDSEQARVRMAEIEGKIAALRSERDKIATSVRPDVLKRYGNIRMRKGLALAPVSARHLSRLQHEHPSPAVQRPPAGQLGRDLPLLPPDHLLGRVDEGSGRGRQGPGREVERRRRAERRKPSPLPSPACAGEGEQSPRTAARVRVLTLLGEGRAAVARPESPPSVCPRPRSGRGQG